MFYKTTDNQQVYYEVIGNEGEYLTLIHGNTVSSKIFRPLLKKLSKTYRLILVDLAGHGKSSRLEKFPVNFWEYQADIVKGLLDSLHIEKTSILGCSGGGIIALNMGMRNPEKINKIIADSIPGEHTVPGNIDILLMDRSNGHKKFTKRMFWKLMHGKDWKDIVNKDSAMLEEFKSESLQFFSSDLSSVSLPVLLTGSSEDELIPLQESIYKEICVKNRNFTAVIYNKGKHPSMLFNKKRFVKTITEFLGSEVTA
jgi:valacyclovir hydrolase